MHEVKMMDQEQQDFYRKIRREIREFLDKKNFEYGHLLLLAPDFFYLMVQLILDKRTPNEKKLRLGLAVAYFIMPLDIIPEVIFGPLGYMDDLAIAAYVLNDFINYGDITLVEEHWPGEGDVLKSIQNILMVADNYFGKGLWERIKRKINS